MKVWDYATTTHDGRTGLITMDLGGDGQCRMYRLRFHHGRAPQAGLVSEATVRREFLVEATEAQRVAATKAGLTPANERSLLR